MFKKISKFFSSKKKTKLKFFINLTAGLDLVPEYKRLPVSFVRNQSTLLEQGEYEKFTQELDNNFLMFLAMGYRCCIIDCTSRGLHKASRACWQGIPWIIYCLERAWFDRESKFKYGMHIHFKKKYDSLKKSTRKKLKYFKKFLLTNKIDLVYICEPTTNDGNDVHFKKIVEKYF